MSTMFQPLYKQVYDVLLQRLKDGVWRAYDLLPSEFALADELGVSQGTVRKALNQMVDEQLLLRQQGKGTYVAGHTQESSLFRFFRWREPNGESLVPSTKVVSSKRRLATKSEQKALSLKHGESVEELVRLRSLLDKPALLEFVIQPLSIFPDIDTHIDLPNSLYTLYQEQYGICVVSVRDQLRATSLPAKYAHYLGVPAGEPVLMVERASINIDGRTVEWSHAYSSTEQFVYLVDLK